MSLLPRVTIAAALVALSTATAYAVPATTLGRTRVYDGPSTRFAVVTVLPPDTDIEVVGCSRGWCELDLEDQEGFVQEDALDFYEREPALIVFPPLVYEYGWNYWRYYNRRDWERWRGRYGLRPRPYVAPSTPPPGPRPSLPNMAPPSSRQGPPRSLPNMAPPSSRQGPPPGAPYGGPGLPQRGDHPSAPQPPQDLGQPPPPPGGMAPPGR
jgi:uncharacterized protein YraI